MEERLCFALLRATLECDVDAGDCLTLTEDSIFGGGGEEVAVDCVFDLKETFRGCADRCAGAIGVERGWLEIRATLDASMPYGVALRAESSVDYLGCVEHKGREAAGCAACGARFCNAPRWTSPPAGSLDELVSLAEEHKATWRAEAEAAWAQETKR